LSRISCKCRCGKGARPSGSRTAPSARLRLNRRQFLGRLDRHDESCGSDRQFPERIWPRFGNPGGGPRVSQPATAFQKAHRKLLIICTVYELFLIMLREMSARAISH
jgi:hypothetical protein